MAATPTDFTTIKLPAACIQAASLLQTPEKILEHLGRPEHIHTRELMVVRDDGTKLVVPAWRIQHNNWRGPYKGGIRFHPNVSPEEISILSSLMTFKTAVVGIPLGGGKGGVQIDAKNLSPAEHERLARAYIRAFADVIGSDTDIPAPDVNTNGNTMGWMTDEYARIVGHWAPGVVTGKPIELFGCRGRQIATSFGGKIVLDSIVAELNLAKTPLTVAIQGAGNVGGGFAQLMASDSKYKIVAISDSQSAVYSRNGLDIANIFAHKASTGAVENADYVRNFTNGELLELPVDILVLGAIEDQITVANANHIQAKVILELANHPITDEADTILGRRNVLIIPDIVANAGGVAVSYFEWVQNQQNWYWSETEVNRRLTDLMTKAANDVWLTARQHHTDLRTSAYILALHRLTGAAKWQAVV